MRPPFLNLPTPAPAQAPPFVALNRRLEAVLAELRSAQWPWILGASGGIDSSAAMLLLARAEVPCLVVHVQHHLRADAHRDQAIVQRQCALLGLPCYVVHLQPPSPEEAENLSARSRRLRYDALTTIAQQTKSQLLTAHHTEDLLETFLLRVQRGTGLAQAFGLQETMSWRGQSIHRPLLTLWKADLRALVDAAELPWIEDSSNNSDAYARNALRQAIAPLVAHLGGEPRFAETLATIAQEATQLREAAQALPQLATLFESPPAGVGSSTGGWWLERGRLRERFADVAALQQSLYQWCRDEGFSVRREILADVSAWTWRGETAQRDARGLQFQCGPLGLSITPTAPQSKKQTKQPPPTVDFMPLSSRVWTTVGTLRLRVDLETNVDSAPVVFARPLQAGDRFPSPHSSRLVGVRKRLARDGVSAELRAQAVVLALMAPATPKSLERSGSSDQRESPQPSTVSTRGNPPCSASIATLTSPNAKSSPHADEPRADAYRVVGVVYASGQRVALVGEQGEKLHVVSDGAKPSND